MSLVSATPPGPWLDALFLLLDRLSLVLYRLLFGIPRPGALTSLTSRSRISSRYPANIGTRPLFTCRSDLRVLFGATCILARPSPRAEKKMDFPTV